VTRRTVKSPLASDGTLYEQFHPGRFEVALERLKRDQYLSGDELAQILEHNGPAALPDELHDYLIRHLRGKIRSRRRYLERQNLEFLKDSLGAAYYMKALRLLYYLEERALRLPPGRRNTPPKGEPAIHERAMELAARRLGMTPQTLRNRLSKRRLLGAGLTMRKTKRKEQN